MSVLRYLLLGVLRVRHGYFADGLARRMQFLPDAPTQRQLDAYELLTRANGHALSVHVPEHRLQQLWQAARQATLTLDFALRCSDPDFALYSEAPVLPDMSLPLPAGEAQDAQAWLRGLGQQVELQLQPRRTRWKYLLLGDWQDQQPQVVDPAGQLSFEAATETLGDGQIVPSFIASSTLPLAERDAPRLQLHDAASQPPRILVSRLPGAAPRGLQRQTLQGQRADVSEIFLSR
jgi:hypothetical protein